MKEILLDLAIDLYHEQQDNKKLRYEVKFLKEDLLKERRRANDFVKKFRDAEYEIKQLKKWGAENDYRSHYQD